LNSPLAIEMLKLVSSGFGERILIGAGTVMNEREVDSAASAGARFVLSPNRNVNVIRQTKSAGLLSFPGCFTCSEIAEALDTGADAVKLFPAQLMTPRALRSIRAPLGNVRMIPTGGVSCEQIGPYLLAGAWAFGIGSELVGADVKEPGGLHKLLARAKAFVHCARDGGPE
jgi:Entner-Doudoroff aldolase